MIDTDKHFRSQERIFNKIFANKPYILLPWQKSYIKRITNFMLKKDYKGKKLLDIGAGDGYTTIEMANLGLQITSLDLSAEALKNINTYAKNNKIKNIITIHANAQFFSFKDKTFDYIVANAILEHLPEEKLAISEWKRVLKPGGRIFIAVPLKFKYIYPFFWLINYIHDKRLGHLRRDDLSSLQKKFNLKTINYFYTGHLIKFIGALYSYFFHDSRFDNKIEKIDEKGFKKAYGASIINVIFEKGK